MIPEGWKIELLGEFMIVKDGVHQTPTYTESGIPFLRVTDIQNEKINLLNTKYISKEEHEKITARLKPKKGDILYSKNGTIGITRIIDWDWEFSFFVSLALLRFKNNGYSVQYIAQYLQSSIAKREIYQGSKQGSVINLHLEEIQKFRVPLPPLPEQCKIAEILGAWDDAIALLEKLIAAKRKLKQGLMQQLLTGKKRFKEFDRESSFFVSSDYFESKLSDFPDDWLKVPIGKVCRSIVPGRNKPKQFDGNIPWITTPNITQKYISTKNTNLFVSEEEIKLCGGKIVPKGAVIINCVGDFGIIGIAQQELVINQQLHAFVCPKELNSEYIFYALSIQTHHMLKVATTTTIPYMNKSSCESIPILLPPPLEQEKIASVLSAADTEISTLEKQLAAYKQQKRGLMQQLLTGKTRVRVN
jgi:type I restriction enzyme, S subunit